MYKFMVIVALFLSGCSNIKVTGTMCDNINTKAGEIVRQECRAYNEKKAEKAFEKGHKKRESVEDIIEFNKEENDN